jgi:hypothetical protein
MHHALGAFLVIAGAVGVPAGLRHQRLEALGIAFAAQIGGALPAGYSRNARAVLIARME